MAKTQGDYEKAEQYALDALSNDPTNGHAMSILIPVYKKLNDDANVDNVITLAPKLWVAHSYVHSTLADYWAEQGDAEKVLYEWDLLITRHRILYKPIFPILLSYAQTDDSRFLLTPYVTKPSIWWKDFFTYMVNNKVSLPVLQYFYQQRMLSDVPLEDFERKAYVRRLQQAKFWKLAYSSWVGGLTSKQFSYIGTVFDGGFEGSSHDTGYDWSFRRSKQVKIKLANTRGIEGKRALHIVFKSRKSMAFQHVWQRLLLESGQSYQVTMKTRIDGLKNPEGLVWRISCADETTQQLVESPALKGRENWHDIQFAFTVPKQGCSSQILRLEAKSQYPHERFFKGGIWFDNIQITPVSKVQAETKGDL